MSARRVLLVEDEGASRVATGKFLEAMGHSVQLAADAQTALESSRRSPPEVLVCDCNLAQAMDGLPLARAIAEACGAAVILVSGHPPETLRQHLEGLETAALFQKPVSLKALAEAVAAA